MLEHKYPFEALGTQWSIETEVSITDSLKEVIQNRIVVFDSVYSRFRKNSLVASISENAGKYTFPKDADRLFSFYRNLFEITNSKVTPLIGDMVARAGYDADYSLQPKEQLPVERWDDVMTWDGKALTTKSPLTLDFGAAGKGYLVDIISSILDEHSINEYVVDASGDLKHKGVSENKVGLEHPLTPGTIIGAVDVQNKSLCASASNRRAWGDDMHHIFDPVTMSPTRAVVATWVIADEAMVADGLATALFFTEAKKLSRVYEFEYVRMLKDGSVEYSPYFEDKLF